MISNLIFVFGNFEPKSPNFRTFWTKKYQLIINLNKILPAHYFGGADFKPDIRSMWFLACLVPRLHKLIQSLRFATYLENAFSFFRKSFKTLWPQLLFFEDTYCKCNIKNLSIC